MERQHELDLVKRMRATGKRDSHFAYCNYACERADLHEWYYSRGGFVTFLGEAFSRYEALRKRSGLTHL
jgi:hypothetical protein